MFKKLYLLLAAACLFAVAINSCKKDSNTEQQNKISDPVILQAKGWYENTYPANNNKQATQATTVSKDLSQIIKPDWQHPASYSRFNKKVIEMPVDPSVKFNSSLKNMTTGQVSDRANSRSSYILLSDGSTYIAYIMTLIADSAYLKNDPGKLAHNTYNKRDADYSGLVLYFTPQGRYVGGWRYQDGKIVTPGKSSGNTTQKTQSAGNNKLSPQDIGEDCTDWYWVTYDNGIAINWEYMYTTCRTAPGGGGNSGGGGAPTIPECPGTNSIKHPVVNNLPLPPDDGGGSGGGGGGFPPPPQPSPCTVDATVTNNVNDPCLKKMVDAAVRSDITYNLNESMLSIFNSNTAFNLNFVDDVASNLKDPAESAETTGSAQPEKSGDRIIITSMDLQITFNKTVLSNASKEYVTATIMHEAIHAYLRYSQTIVSQHLDMARNYISVMADQLLKLYPNLSPIDAKNLAWGGLEKDPGSLYTDLSQVEKNNIDITNANYKTGKSGTPCP